MCACGESRYVGEGVEFEEIAVGFFDIFDG